MAPEERHLRADAERNRQRLLDTAQALFRERGLEVSVAEIAEAAGVGRGTLFRNFASKEELIAAVVAKRMREAAARGEELISASDPTDGLFEFLAHMVGTRELDRALFEALDEEWMARVEIRPVAAEIVEVIGRLLRRAQADGGVRADVGPMDVLLLFKGACMASSPYTHVDPTIVNRHLDLIRASLTTSRDCAPLRGRTPTLEEIEEGRPAPVQARPAPAAVHPAADEPRTASA